MGTLESSFESTEPASVATAKWDVDLAIYDDCRQVKAGITRRLKDPWFPWEVDPHALGSVRAPRNDVNAADQPELASQPPAWITRVNLSDTTTVPAPPYEFGWSYTPDTTYLFTHYNAADHTATSVVYEHNSRDGWHVVTGADGAPFYAQSAWQGTHSTNTWSRFDPSTSTTETVTMGRDPRRNRWHVATETRADGAIRPQLQHTPWTGGITEENRPPWLLREGLTDRTEIPALPREARPGEIYQLSYFPPHTNTVWYANYRSDESGHLHLGSNGANLDVRTVSMPLGETDPVWNVYSTGNPRVLLEQYLMARDRSGGWYPEFRRTRDRDDFVFERVGHESEDRDDVRPLHDET